MLRNACHVLSAIVRRRSPVAGWPCVLSLTSWRVWGDGIAQSRPYELSSWKCLTDPLASGRLVRARNTGWRKSKLHRRMGGVVRCRPTTR